VKSATFARRLRYVEWRHRLIAQNISRRGALRSAESFAGLLSHLTSSVKVTQPAATCCVTCVRRRVGKMKSRMTWWRHVVEK